MSLLVATPGAAPAPEPAARPSEVVSLTFAPHPGEGLQDFCRRFADRLRERSLAPLHLLAFGHCRAAELVTDSLRQACGFLDCPVTWAEGAACGGNPLAGLQVHASSGAIERISVGGNVVASVFTDGGARQCLVGGMTAKNRAASRAEQTAAVLAEMGTVLAEAGFELGDVIRTWFYLEDILSWYDDFNRVRTGIYSHVKFRTGSLPASTGVGAKNPAGTALMVAAWAFRPVQKSAYAQEIASPLQCPAPAYGSSFSRAMEISTNAGRRLFISGTASIAPGGKTQWVGDVRKQVELTMDVVEAMLRARGFAFPDLERATAYFRHAGDVGAFRSWLAENSLENLPVVATQCDVCRDDLLFELEAEAAAPGMRRI